jgi:hypothetical protein
MITYNVNEPLYKQTGIDEALAAPFQKCVDGLVIGRTMNLIAPRDFERHMQRAVSALLKIKEQRKLKLNPKIRIG